MLYSAGKDSSVMLHLAMKAFAPAKPPFPLLHVDTTWKFREMIQFRDNEATRLGLRMIVHVNRDGLERGVDPFASGSELHTQGDEDGSAEAGFGQLRFRCGIRRRPARRGKKPREGTDCLYSVGIAWLGSEKPAAGVVAFVQCEDSEGQSVRVFPLSNWTERDVWQYVLTEQIPVVPLYFAKQRAVVERDGMLIVRDDERMVLRPGEKPQQRLVRFRTLGCYPLTGAIETSASSVSEILAELAAAQFSERRGRSIDRDSNSSMERKKREGYF